MPGVNIALIPRNLCVDWEVNKMSRGGGEGILRG